MGLPKLWRVNSIEHTFVNEIFYLSLDTSPGSMDHLACRHCQNIQTWFRLFNFSKQARKCAALTNCVSFSQTPAMRLVNESWSFYNLICIWSGTKAISGRVMWWLEGSIFLYKCSLASANTDQPKFNFLVSIKIWTQKVSVRQPKKPCTIQHSLPQEYIQKFM